jgi:hypothetical protein
VNFSLEVFIRGASLLLALLLHLSHLLIFWDRWSSLVVVAVDAATNIRVAALTVLVALAVALLAHGLPAIAALLGLLVSQLVALLSPPRYGFLVLLSVLAAICTATLRTTRDACFEANTVLLQAHAPPTVAFDDF